MTDCSRSGYSRTAAQLGENRLQDHLTVLDIEHLDLSAYQVDMTRDDVESLDRGMEYG